MGRSIQMTTGLTAIAAMVLIGCGPGTETKAGEQLQNQPQQQTQSKPGDSAPTNSAPAPAVLARDTDKPTFQGFGVIREFAGTDTAALFGMLPSQGTLQITNITGPAFLGNAHVGQLTKDAMDHLFLNSSVPMPQSERDSLVSQYAGAQVIYFEKYSGNLCAGPDSEFKVSATGTDGDTSAIITFDFDAEPTPNGDCKFHVFLVETQD